MQYTRLGRTGLEVSRLCLGCMSFGDPKAGNHEWTLDPCPSNFLYGWPRTPGKEWPAGWLEPSFNLSGGPAKLPVTHVCRIRYAHTF